MFSALGPAASFWEWAVRSASGAPNGGPLAFPPAMAKCATIAAAERLTSAPKPEPFMVTGPRAQAATPAMKDAPRPRGAEGDRSLARAAKGRAIF
jgi:hypothetical protein